MWWKHRTPQKNKPAVNSDLYQKTLNDRVKYQELLDHLIELNTIRWTHDSMYKGIYVNHQYNWNTKHPYIQKLLKKKLVKLVREKWNASHGRTLLQYYKEIIMAKYVGEVLAELNKNTKLFDSEYKKVGNGGPLGVIFYHAFTKNGKFDLPAGDPPFKPAPEPLGMTPSQFITETRKFHYFCNTRLTSAKREMLFVQMCESIHPDEAKILCAIKDQKLHEMYPNLTPQVAAKAGFVNAEDLIEVVVEKKKSPKSKNAKGTGESDSLPEELTPQSPE